MEKVKEENMLLSPFKIIQKSFLGIDIGTSAIKIVELSRWGERRKLESYGELSSRAIFKKPFRTFERSTLLLSTAEIARAISAIIREAKIKTREVIFSIPDFSSFFTNFTLPPMTKEELPLAIRYEARLHVPLPLAEVTLDWEVIEGELSDKKATPLKILLVSVPNEVIYQYQQIAELSNLKLQALEAEVFGLMRSLIKEKKMVISLVEIGAQSTTCSIIDQGTLRISHSFDLAGNPLTEQIAKSLDIDWEEAENFKKKYGLIPSPQNLRQILIPLIDLILTEIEKTFNNFYQAEGKKVEKIILAGGTVWLPGLKEYFSEKIGLEIEIANPFADIFYPPILEKTLKKMGPAYAITVGTALRGLE